MSKRKSLPPLSAKVPAELRPLMAAIAEIIETGEGLRGDKLDRKVTYRDLLDGGVARLRVPGNPDAGMEPPSQQQDRAIPPRPTGFSAVGSFFGMVHLSWDRPQELYNNHAFTNIYRSEEDNFATAVMVGREAGAFYSDLVRDDATAAEDPLNLPGYFYWITFSSAAGMEGPPNAASGSHAQPLQDAAYLLGQLSGQLGESVLEEKLRQRLDGFGTSISQQSEVVQGLSASFTLTTDVNGYVSGFGTRNDGKVADFAVLADRFWIARPGAASSAVKPFMVLDGKVYIDSAFIREASIREGQLGPITFGKIIDAAGKPVTTLAGKLRADMLDVDQLRVGDGNISGVLQSTVKNTLGQPRWRLDKDGGFAFNGAGSARTELGDAGIRMWYPNGRLMIRMGTW